MPECGEGNHISGHPALRPLHGPSAQAGMYQLEKKNSKIFSPEGPPENVWGPLVRMFPRALVMEIIRRVG